MYKFSNELFKLILFKRVFQYWRFCLVKVIDFIFRTRRTSFPSFWRITDPFVSILPVSPPTDRQFDLRVCTRACRSIKVRFESCGCGPARIRANEFRTKLWRIWIIAPWSRRIGVNPSRIDLRRKTFPRFLTDFLSCCKLLKLMLSLLFVRKERKKKKRGRGRNATRKDSRKNSPIYQSLPIYLIIRIIHETYRIEKNS